MNAWTRWRSGRHVGTRVGKRVLLLFVAFGLAPALLTLTLTHWRVREALTEQHYSRVGETVEALGLALWERLRMADELAAVLLAHPAEALGDDLGVTFDAAILFGPSGATRHLGAARTEPIPAALSNAALSNAAAHPAAALPTGREGKIVLAPGAPGATAQVWLLRAIPPHEGGPGAIATVAALRISPQFLWIGEDHIPALSSLCVLDDDNLPLHCTEPLPPAALRALAARRLQGMAGRVHWSAGTVAGDPAPEATGNDTQVSVFREVFLKGRFKAGSWNVVLTQPARLALVAERKLREVIWPAAFIALIGALLLAIGQVRRTMGPLRALTGATQRLAARDFSSRLDLRVDNEFAVLGGAFNDMADGLSHQFDTLEALAAIDQVILQGRPLRTVGAVILDLLGRSLATPLYALALDEGGDTGWRVHLPTALWQRLPEDIRSLGAPGARGDLIEWSIGPPAQGLLDALCAQPGLRLHAGMTTGATLLDRLAEQLPPLYLQGIVAEGETVGALFACWTEPLTPTDDERERLASVAARIAVAAAAASREQRLTRQAHFDSLTGLPNRAYFLEQLGQRLVRAAAHATQETVMFVDLDGFSQVNDTLGHAAGDRLLGLVGQRLADSIGSRGLIARLGGDEFALALSNRGDGDEASREAHALIAALSRPFELAGGTQFINASVGIASFPKDGDDADTLLRHADMAMYRAKERGRGSMACFEARMNDEVQLRAQLEAELRIALRDEQFVLHYEPLVVPDTGLPVGAEVLIRWRHPVRGMVSPAHFIPVAEDTGLIVPIGSWVLRRACEQFMHWQREGLPLSVISVNVSVRQFQRPDFVAEVRDVLEATGMPPQGLKLELTESMLMGDATAVERALDELTGLGVSLALDDFGTGYSSLTYLKRLPMDTVKLDRSFVRDLLESADARALARSAIDMLHALRRRVVAEGVELPGQRALLAGWGCDLLQGWLFSRSLAAEDFSAFVRRPPLALEVDRGSFGLARQAQPLEQALELLGAGKADDQPTLAARTELDADIGREGVGETVLEALDVAVR
ncbi:MAG: EAL domain-containing protein [Burkholderiaceae bacterium]|nr:EAL domain-containing protein [Burkholderiaceae bacterium]